MDERDRKLKKIKDEILCCQKCELYKTRKYPVIGEGSHQAKIIFIGEAPGRQENLTGHPFCGASGKILNELLASIEIERKEVYITNILKDWPPGNRNPQEAEIEACVPYLLRQIEIIKPKVICTLGNFSTGFILRKYGLEDKIQGISKIHGKIFKSGGIIIIPFYHPAVVVYNRLTKKVLIKDFQILKNLKAL